MSSRKQRTYDVIVTREVLGIQQRPKKRRRTYPRVRLLSVPLLIGLVVAMFHLLTSPAYTVHKAVVRGNKLVSAEAIYQTGKIAGRNLFLLNTRAVADAIERLPHVKQAWIYTQPPAQVAIVVQEYKPRWIWATSDNRYWIDETGNILPDNGTLEGALTVVDMSGQSLPIGSKLEPGLVKMLDALDHLLPHVEVGYDKEVTYNERLGFVIQVGPGWSARIGNSADQLASRIGVLNSLLPELLQKNRDVDFIDLRYTERPYSRFK